MRKLKHIMLLAGAVAAVIGSILSATYTYKMFDAMDRIRRNSHADTYRLQAQIKQLEEELNGTITDRLFGLIRPVGGTYPAETISPVGTETDPETEAEAEIDSESVTEPESETMTESDSETNAAVTLPAFHETTPTESETDTELKVETDTETDPQEESTSEPESESISEPESESEAETESESVTLPTHESQETDPVEPETTEPETTTPSPSVPSETPTEMYIITTHNGRIGVFDATGTLVRTVNVFVFTLPEADRKALEVGIPAYSRAEADRIAGKYE